MAIWETIFFYVFAFGAVVTSFAVIVYRNPLYSAIALILDFFCFAGLYAMLSAHFIAVTQVLVYGGAIMVLFVFIIMLLNLRDEELGDFTFRVHHLLAVAVGVAVFGFSASAIMPLVDRAKVQDTRQRVAEETARKVEEAGDDDEVPEPVVQTPARVPGLFADLNETALEAQWLRYKRRLRTGGTKPWTGKYRPRDPERRVEIPPVMEGKDPRGGPLEEPVAFGTVEPISILLVNRFVVPFELTALLLLAAIVGAVIIAKKRL